VSIFTHVSIVIINMSNSKLISTILIYIIQYTFIYIEGSKHNLFTILGL